MEARNDLNRLGLFSELGYISIGDPYVPPNSKPFNINASKGKQILPGGAKSKSALQSGYFDKSFDRIMQGEAYTDPVKRRRQERISQSKKNLGKPFVPSHSGKKPSGANSHYGTFSGPVNAFSPLGKGKKSYASPGRNFITNPLRKGTGYGYVNVLIGKPQTYSTEPYDRGRELVKKGQEDSKGKMKGGAFKLNLCPKQYFDVNPYKADRPLPPLREPKTDTREVKPFKQSSPGKEIGGSKAGCFNGYPSHSNDPYVVHKNSFRSFNDGGEKKIFRPSQGPKSCPTKSVISQNVQRRINRLTYKQPVTVSI
ncbi:cilia-and flagella-associated protein 96-like [Rhopilema esculentum]|uniref:cilia-and flagella-associated protein 96-like n=1 Tax=Rhopilema esculentum TaxID=499914 RepID=UPI0031D61479